MKVGRILALLLGHLTRLMLWMAVCMHLLFQPCSCAAEPVPPPDPPQFCPHEIFNATCLPGHVVLMTSAFYGRMRTGRCIRTDTFIGCRTDVLTFVDRKCSGRTTCSVDVSSSELFAMQNCPKDLYAYLEATYECVELSGLPETGSACATGQIVVDRPSGYLYGANLLPTRHLAAGLLRCPWRILVKPGQQVKVTLFDFTPPTGRSISSEHGRGHHGQVGEGRVAAGCGAYVIFREAHENDREVCVQGLNSRSRVVYESTGSELLVHVGFETHARRSEHVFFLLKYEATGCADLVPSDNAHVERMDRGSTVVSCVNSHEKSHLVCQDKTWVGEQQNCSSALGMRVPLEADGSRRADDMPVGLLLAISTGVVIGIVLGFASLIVAFYSRNGRRRMMLGKEREPAVMVPMPAMAPGEVLQDAWINDDRASAYKLFDLRPRSPVDQYSAGIEQYAGSTCHRCCPDVATLGGGGDYGVLPRRADDVINAANHPHGDYAERRSLMRARAALLSNRGVPVVVDGNNSKDLPATEPAGNENNLAAPLPASVRLNNEATHPFLQRANSCGEQQRSLYQSLPVAAMMSAAHYGTYGARAQLAYATPLRTNSRDSSNRVTWREVPTSEH